MPRPNLFERRMSRFMREPATVRSAARVIMAATTVIVVVSGVAMRLIDHQQFFSIWQGMWWSVQTVTTVGYGDVTPTSTAGKFLASGVMLAGIALVAVVTAAVTSSFVARAQQQLGAAGAADDEAAEKRLDDRLDDITARLDRVERMLTTISEQSRGPG
jgi:voltage-gated potassium channel